MLSNKFNKIIIKELYIFFILTIFLNICLFSIKSDVIYIDNLSSNNLKTLKTSILKLHKSGKKVIPLLISKITCEKKIDLLLVDPRESALYSYLWEKCNGVLPAYIIEMILALEKINEKNYFKTDFILGSNIKNYIYYHGIIVTKKCKILKKSDISKIKNIYKLWWDKNKQKSLEDLRTDWKKNNKPLSDSIYHWE